MKVETVTGPVQAEQLGMTLMHEHLFIDMSCWFDIYPSSTISASAREEPLTLRNLGIARRDPIAVKSNAVLDDEGCVADELTDFKARGGGTIVDVTVRGIGPRPAALKALSLATGVKIVAGCGYYVEESHPADLSLKDESEIADQFVRELTVGFDGTDVKAGIIGEIGTSATISATERKVLRAAGRAHQACGAPISVHVYPWGRTGLEILDILEEAGVDPGRVVLCHMDVLLDVSYHLEIVKRGAYIEYDNFQHEYTYDALKFSYPKDIDRVKAIADLVDKGARDKLLLSNDICYKMFLKKYGGFGYSHVLQNVVPMFAWVGLGEADAHAMLVDNPRRVLAAA